MNLHLHLAAAQETLLYLDGSDWQIKGGRLECKLTPTHSDISRKCIQISIYANRWLVILKLLANKGPFAQRKATIKITILASEQLHSVVAYYAVRGMQLRQKKRWSEQNITTASRSTCSSWMHVRSKDWWEMLVLIEYFFDVHLACIRHVHMIKLPEHKMLLHAMLNHGFWNNQMFDSSPLILCM